MFATWRAMGMACAHQEEMCKRQGRCGLWEELAECAARECGIEDYQHTWDVLNDLPILSSVF